MVTDSKVCFSITSPMAKAPITSRRKMVAKQALIRCGRPVDRYVSTFNLSQFKDFDMSTEIWIAVFVYRIFVISVSVEWCIRKP